MTCPWHWRSVVTAASVTPAAAKERWHLMSAVCLERLPIITQDITPIEKEMSELYKQMDYEYSCMSDHELRHAEDLWVSSIDSSNIIFFECFKSIFDSKIVEVTIARFKNVLWLS